MHDILDILTYKMDTVWYDKAGWWHLGFGFEVIGPFSSEHEARIKEMIYYTYLNCEWPFNYQFPLPMDRREVIQ